MEEIVLYSVRIEKPSSTENMGLQEPSYTNHRLDTPSQSEIQNNINDVLLVHD